MSPERKINQPTTVSPELRKIRSEAITKRWQNPVAKAKTIEAISQSIKDKWKDPQYRKKASRASSRRMRAKWKDPDYRLRLSETHRAVWKDPKYREKRQNPDRALWEAAQENGLIERIVADNILSQAEIGKLNKFFTTGNNRRRIEDLLDKFSIAVARTA